MALTATEQNTLRQRFVDALSGVVDFSKADVATLFTNIDTYIETTFRAGVNSAIETGQPAKWSAAQKQAAVRKYFELRTGSF